MAQVNWTHEAEVWLQSIYGFIASDSPSAAYRTIERIIERAEILAKFPEIGARLQLREGQHEEIRELLYGHYRIAYVIKDDGLIDILGVFHAAMDIDRYF